MTQLSPIPSTRVGRPEISLCRAPESTSGALDSEPARAVQFQVRRAPDQADISEAARLISKDHEPGIRSDKVFQIRAQLESGQYEIDDHKLNVVTDHILQDLQQQA
jgi:anti-sigma28 factor (negative regulator of flagellin synthesis)